MHLVLAVTNYLVHICGCCNGPKLHTCSIIVSYNKLPRFLHNIAQGNSFSLSSSLFQHDQRSLASITHVQRFQKAEFKIVIVLSYHLLTGAAAMLVEILASQNIESFTTEVGAYFICESTPGQDCERSYIDGQLPSQVLADTSLMAYLLLAAVNLIYVINSQTMKAQWTKFKTKLHHSCFLWSSSAHIHDSGDNDKTTVKSGNQVKTFRA